MWKFVITGVVIVAVVIAGFSLIDGGGQGDISAEAAFLAPQTDLTGFSRALDPYTWSFPRDHGSHDTFQTEWWYYTGNLATADGRRFGYQFTIFRRAITPTAQTVSEASAWRTGQIFMAHFTLSDIAGERFYHDERYSRGGAGLAGALPNDREPDAAYQVFVEDWQVQAAAGSTTAFQISARSPQGFGVNLTLEPTKAPALQGDNGLSPKSEEPGNASYYYSLTRLATDGTITIDGATFAVTGNTWMDHEFSTSALGTDAQGWDWFGLQFADGREVMLGKIRLNAGGREPAFGGLLINADGSTRYLSAADFSIEPTADWRSPHTGAVYPAGWTMTIRGAALDTADDLVFTVTPLLADQELHSGAIAYWEGAVALSGMVSGYGYAELTGYVDTMSGRF